MVRIFVFICCLFGTFACQNAGAAPTCGQNQCVGIVDVGSSGSRFHIYSYRLDAAKSPTQIKEIWSKKITPGFSTLTANANTVNNYLNQLFLDSPEKNVKVYFYATAGMRLLSKVKQQQLYSLAKNWFVAHPEFKLMEAKTITGSEEGLFAWLAINYRLNLLGSNREPVSIVDMGGASVQVVTPVDARSNVEPSELVRIKVQNRSYQLFVHSFLGLGQTELTHQFLDANTCFARNYQLPDGSRAEGDAESCQTDVTKLINLVHGVDTKVQPIIEANPAKQWYALGGLAILAAQHPFDFENREFTSNDLLEKADSEICRQDWETVQRQNPNEEAIYNYCLVASYYYALLVNGYGLSPQQPINVLADESANWTLGAVIAQSIQKH
ncbi:ectonucleoside triphosphate diphosphohydrolase I [Legionella adelaidensis]|uniref:Ectonucleoside triphosphate diphosphohydrolase I n=1 Tax=Legionella adelaidensis TaxID=45056 RepID=A0A0W0R4B8_9GAMM|nr:hypothetical protein [Legionella adelaidensis]KTC65893.1 ectonucleoside triphosphate diphosphohydrolase I [Legionella adelaidensis]